MTVYDLNSDGRDTDQIRWEAGGRSHVTILVGGQRVFRGEIQKAQRVTIAYADAGGEEE